MNIHKNARLTQQRREEMALSVIKGHLSKARAARICGVTASGLDRVQLLSPYRGGPSGALGLSHFMRDTYRADAKEDACRAIATLWRQVRSSAR